MYDALVKGLQRVNGEVVSYINAGDFYNLNTFSNIKKIFSENRISFGLPEINISIMIIQKS